MGRIGGKQDRTVGLADTAYDASTKNDYRDLWSANMLGCLDLSESTDERSLLRTYFDMNKFEDAEEDFVEHGATTENEHGLPHAVVVIVV